MKKINAILLFFIITLISCQKEDYLQVNNKSSIRQSDGKYEIFSASSDKYSIATCAYNIGDRYVFGVRCDRTEYTNQCPKAFSCTPVKIGNDYIEYKKIIELGFTQVDIDHWLKGENILTNEKWFVERFYDFYVILYNQGLSYHPDEILKNYPAN